jgi:hypothetical protein
VAFGTYPIRTSSMLAQSLLNRGRIHLLLYCCCWGALSCLTIPDIQIRQIYFANALHDTTQPSSGQSHPTVRSDCPRRFAGHSLPTSLVEHRAPAQRRRHYVDSTTSLCIFAVIFIHIIVGIIQSDFINRTFTWSRRKIAKVKQRNRPTSSLQHGLAFHDLS